MKKNLRLAAILMIVAQILMACSPDGNDDFKLQKDNPSGYQTVTVTLPDATADVEAIVLTFPIVDTGQDKCFDENIEVNCPENGSEFYGQDAQYAGILPNYLDNGDGTVTDINTGLMWVQDAGDKVQYYQGISAVDEFEFAGFDDWRIPTIKELYSLMDFSGIDDAGQGTDPFIDNDYFIFEYGNPSKGEREIDSQWITSNIYKADVMNGEECFFGVNFADGRIKCYPTMRTNSKGYFLRLVRGNVYGENEFSITLEGNIMDSATGMMWQRNDAGEGLDWPSALKYCETSSEGGYYDWRLPNAKELQSIVDYSRSPEVTNSAAIDPIFNITEITNEAGQTDYGYYWTSTTHENANGGTNAVYISFGRAMGDMGYGFIDVHGAGAQRSDPKVGNIEDYPTTRGPQGDVLRVENMVRCVRGGASESGETDVKTVAFADEVEGSSLGDSQIGQAPSQSLDTSHPGSLQRPDLFAAAEKLRITEVELRIVLGKENQRPPDLNLAAEKLGIDVQKLMDALGIPGDMQP